MRANWIYLVVIVIGMLLLANSLLTQYNNTIIQQNKKRLEETAVVKAYYDQIGRVVIQAIDIGLRGYAIVPEQAFGAPMDNAILWKDSILSHVAEPLREMNYNLTEFEIFRDSLDAYVQYCLHLKHLLSTGQRSEFDSLFRSDRGRFLYGRYIQGEKNIVMFLSKVNDDAEAKYQAALIRNYQVQLVLFMLCFPTLLYTAYVTHKSFRLSEQRRRSESGKNVVLTQQNLDLESMVSDRTREIAAQNEELATQRDELSLQNKHYQEAQRIIEQQNLEIISKNRELEIEVGVQTEELRGVNRELLEQNSQLEQFAFIAAHNLRAPVARMLGLANLISIAANADEKEFAIEKLIVTTGDIDQVIKDLSQILDTKRYIGENIQVDFQSMLSRVLNLLDSEINTTGAIVTADFSKVGSVITSVSYLESIVYNLLHNAIKYRSSERSPLIRLATALKDNYVVLTVCDNGLGIDLNKYGAKVFNLYKRFHHHVEGRGMGLFLVKSQITALGGKVEIESELDVGTTFHIYFTNG